MLYTTRLRFSCDKCRNGHRQQECWHYNRIAENIVYTIGDRGRPTGLDKIRKDNRERIRLKKAELDDSKNEKCSRSGLYKFQCRKGCCPKDSNSYVFLKDESIELASVVDGKEYPCPDLEPFRITTSSKFVDHNRKRPRTQSSHSSSEEEEEGEYCNGENLFPSSANVRARPRSASLPSSATGLRVTWIKYHDEKSPNPSTKKKPKRRKKKKCDRAGGNDKTQDIDKKEYSSKLADPESDLEKAEEDLGQCGGGKTATKQIGQHYDVCRDMFIHQADDSTMIQGDSDLSIHPRPTSLSRSSSSSSSTTRQLRSRSKSKSNTSSRSSSITSSSCQAKRSVVDAEDDLIFDYDDLEFSKGDLGKQQPFNEHQSYTCCDSFTMGDHLNHFASDNDDFCLSLSIPEPEVLKVENPWESETDSKLLYSPIMMNGTEELSLFENYSYQKGTDCGEHRHWSNETDVSNDDANWLVNLIKQESTNGHMSSKYLINNHDNFS